MKAEYFEFPDDRSYLKSHIWAKSCGGRIWNRGSWNLVNRKSPVDPVLSQEVVDGNK